MYDYVEARLVPCRDGSIDVTGSGLTAEKVLDLWAFRGFNRQPR